MTVVAEGLATGLRRSPSSHVCMVSLTSGHSSPQIWTTKDRGFKKLKDSKYYEDGEH